MFVGASPAGTGGGIKTTTVSVLLLSVFSVIRGRQDTEIFGRQIPNTIVKKALTISVISFAIFITVSMVLSLVEPYPMVDLLYETASALGTAGLAAFNNNTLKPAGKILIILSMFAGRVGPLTITLALAMRLSRDKGNLKYPEEKIMVG